MEDIRVGKSDPAGFAPINQIILPQTPIVEKRKFLFPDARTRW